MSSDAPLPAARPTSAAWSLLAAAVLAQAAISLAEMAVPVLAPFLREDLQISVGAVGLIVASVNLGRIVGAIAAGRIIDDVGEELVIVMAGLGVAAFIWVAALTDVAFLIAAALMFLGAFAGSATPTGAKLVMSAFPIGHRGTAMGIRQSAIPLGTLLAAAVVPAIAQATSWQTAFAVAGIAPLGAALIARVIIHRQLHFARLPAPVGRPPRAQPVAPRLRSLMRDRSIACAVSWGATLIAGQYALVTYLILDLTTERGTSLAVASAALALLSVAGIVGRIGWGAVSDRLFRGRRTSTMVLVTLLGAGASALLAVLPSGAPTLSVLAVAVLAGVSFHGWQGVWVSLLAELGTRRAAPGATVGLGASGVNVAVVAWPPLLGLLADATGGFRTGWTVLAAVTAASAVLVLGITES